MSSSRPTQKFRCTSCGQCFLNRNAFTKHIKYATGNCKHSTNVFKCQYCKREFTNQKGLDHHIRMNQYCSVLSDPQKMSLIPFPSAPTQSDTIFEVDEYSAQWTMKKRKAQDTNESNPPSNPISHDEFTIFKSGGDKSSNLKNQNNHYSLKEIRSIFHSARHKSSDDELV